MTIKEKELEIPALQIAAGKPNGFVSTSDLIVELEALFKPSGEDASVLSGRNDTKFSQKVRNLVSHREGNQTIFTKGYAEYDDVNEGIKITDSGRRFLKTV